MFEKREELKVERLPILKTTRSVQGVRKDYFINAYTYDAGFDIKDAIKRDKTPYQVIEVRHKQTLGLKIQWDSTYNMVAMIFCYMDTSCITTFRKKRIWNEFCRCYISKNKEFFKSDYLYDWTLGGYVKDEKKMAKYSEKKWSLMELFSSEKPGTIVIIDSPERLLDDEGNEAWDQTDAMRPFHNLFGALVPIGGNRVIALDSISSLDGYMTYNPPTGNGTQKKNEELNELLKYELPNVQEPSDLPEINKNFGWLGRKLNPMFENVQKYAVIQKVDGLDDPTCVIRTFFKSPDYNVSREGGRIYVMKKKVISSRTLEDGSFIYQKLLNKPVHWNFYIDDFDSEVTKGTMLEYYGDIVKNIPKETRGLAIWSFMKWPITEQMYKIEYMRPFMDKLFKLSVVSSPAEILEIAFGKLNENKNLYKMIGINKWQAEMMFPLVEENMPAVTVWNNSYGISPVRFIKYVMSDEGGNYSTSLKDDLSDVDRELFEWFVDVESLCFERWPIKDNSNDEVITEWSDLRTCHSNHQMIMGIMDCLRVTRKTYGVVVMKRMFPLIFNNMGKFINTDNNYNNVPYGWRVRSHGEFSRFYKDYVELVRMLDMKSRMKPYFNNLEELMAMHNFASDLYNREKDKSDKCRWDMRAKDAGWSKWEYENENFVVVSPKKPSDLAEEGITLHHCVKSYIGRVIDGGTNIMFIRKKGEEDKPFFTVEIDNKCIIQQVHGMCNRNADTEPGMVEFVNEWAKAKKIKMNTYNKVR